MEFDWSSLQGLTALQCWLGAQVLLVGTSLLCHVAQGTTVNVKTDPPGLGEPEPSPRFYQFRKRMHTYFLVGLLWTAWVAWNVYKAYCLGQAPNPRLATILSYVAVPKRQSADSTCVLLALTVYIIHLVRRLYETMMVSIFSRRQFLSPLDLFWAFSFYLTAALAIIADGPDLRIQKPCYTSLSFSWYHGIGLGLFLWATLHHMNCHKILAKLRRNKAGHIVTSGYKVPHGDWFDYVSCPQYFADILIYVSIGFLLGMRSTTWWWMVAYVVASQLFLAYNSHIWYQRKFTDYPRNRKMLVPFVI